MKEKQIVTVVAPLPINTFFHSKNTELQNLIEKASQIADLTVQQQCVKEFAEYLNESAKPDDKELVLKILTFMFLFTTPKVPIKKTVGRVLTNFKDQELLTWIVSETIKINLDIINKDKPNMEAVFCDGFVTGLSTSMDLKPVVTAILNNVYLVFEPALTILSKLVDTVWERGPGSSMLASPKYQYIYNTSKFLLSVLQKSKAKGIKEQDRLKLITCCYDIMTHALISYDTKNNCAYIIVLLFTDLPENILKECIFKKCPYFEFLKFGQGHSPTLEKLGIKDIKDPTISDTFKACIYSGIMIITPWRALFDYYFNEKTVFSTAFEELIELAKRAKGNPVQVMGIAKAISMLSSCLHGLPPDGADSLVEQGLNYVVTYLDDRAEVVKNSIKAVLKNIIRLAVKYRDEGNPKLLEVILEWLKNLKDGVFYKALEIFAAEVGFTVLLKSIPDLAKQLLYQLIHPSKAHNICSCYEKLMELHLKEVASENDWVSYWVNVIVGELKQSKPPLTQFFQRLFVSAFKMQSIALKAITRDSYLNTDAELGAFLSCIHHARKNGLNLSIESLYAIQIDKDDFWNNLMEYKTLDVLTTYQNNEIRILVLAIIVESHKSTEAFTEWELEILLKYIQYSINTPNAAMRQQIVSYIKKALLRLAQSVDLKTITNQGILTSSQKRTWTTSESYHECISNFWHTFFCKVLLPGLNPDCNYSRKSACLELLCYASTFFTFKVFFGYWKDRDFNNLKDIVQYDTYEKNKDMAAQLLILCRPTELGFDQQECVAKYIDDCFQLAVSIKPCDTISAAYMLKLSLGGPHIHDVILERLCKTVSRERLVEMTVSDQFFQDSTCMLLYQLVFELKNCAEVAEHSLQEAAACKPLHGFLFCIRHILKSTDLRAHIKMPYWKIFVKDILYWCFHLSEVIGSIICNQSPEGFLPDDCDMEVTESDETAKAQMVTVYGWRAAKEISLLLGDLALHAPFYDDNVDGLINEKQLRSIGNHLFYLLLKTKHRGAFEQASIGFSNLCERMWRLPTNSRMPAELLDKILNVLLGVTEQNVDTCATRRSAGVPFIVQAILTTEPNIDGNQYFHSCMIILLTIASDSSKPDEQRTHCMNILRALYRNNQLGEAVIPYCSKGVIIAVEGFGNCNWNIRNSATLLFSALMVRIFGVQRVRHTEIVSIKNKMIAQVFFTRYPELYSFLLEKLEEGMTDVHHPSLFPVLLILSRLYHCPGSTDTFQLQIFLPYMEICFGNPVYRIRDLAAKIVVNLITKQQTQKLILGSFIGVTDVRIQNNHCHGLLLQIQYLLQFQANTLPRLNIEKVFDNTAWILLCCGQQISYITATLYLEILNYLIKCYDPGFQNHGLFKKIIVVIQWLDKTNHSNTVSAAAMKKYRLNMFNLKLCVLLNMFKCYNCQDLQTNCKIYKQYIFEDVKMHRELQDLCLNYMNYLKYSQSVYENHNLYDENNDYDYYEMINTFLKPLSYAFKCFLYSVLYAVLQDILVSQNVKATFNLETLVMHILPNQLKQYDTFAVKQWLLNYTINCSNSSNEHTVRTCIAWLDKFMSELEKSEIKLLKLDNLFDVLTKFCAPAAEASYRLGVAKLLVHNKKLFYHKDCILNWSSVCMLWETVFMLLEDDNEDVRNTICQLCQQDLTLTEHQYVLAPKIRTLTPDFAREVLFYHMVKTIPSHCSITILLSLILRTTGEVTKNNLSEVFEEGASNAYAEFYPTARAATDMLYKILWKMNDGLNFDDKSIFIEEQTYLVATNLYDKFYRNVVPLLSTAMRGAMRNILTRMILFLEKETINKSNFKCHLKSIINYALGREEVKLLDTSEITRLTMFLSIMFKIAL